jgi:hypothetical protein
METASRVASISSPVVLEFTIVAFTFRVIVERMTNAPMTSIV